MFKSGSHMLEISEDIICQTAKWVTPHDHSELERFAKQLCGLEGLTFADLKRRFYNLQIPGDFYHYRLTHVETGEKFGGSVSTCMDRISLDDLFSDILFACLYNDATPKGPGQWSETIALPVIHPGTLELGLRFVPMTPAQLQNLEFVEELNLWLD